MAHDKDRPTDQWLKNLIGDVNARTVEGQLSDAVNKAKHDAHVYIGQRRLPLRELPQWGVTSVHKTYEEVILIVDDGQMTRFVVIKAGCYADSGPFIETEDLLEIQDAYDYEVLPTRLYQDVKDAEKALDDHQAEASATSRLRSVIKEFGPKEVRKVLDAMPLGETQ